jgi:hypothetical protein
VYFSGGNFEEVWCVIVDPPYAIYLQDGSHEFVYGRSVLVGREGLLWTAGTAAFKIFVETHLQDISEASEEAFLRRGCTNWQE